MNRSNTISERIGFLDELREQRWDDHRYYHQSRVNQSLHLVSAITFLCCYVLVFHDPAIAALLGWLVAMITRQSGHFFFEPKTYDRVNDTTHEHKEAIKVGYNLQRKVILHGVWFAAPLLLLASPTLFGLLPQPEGWLDGARNVGMIWFVIAVFAILARSLYLIATQGFQTGIVWVSKILTDPLHDVKLYWRAPLALLKGEWIDPMDDVKEQRRSTRA